MDRAIALDSDATLPGLREELVLHPGKLLDDGSKSWVIHDPARNQFFQISWPEFEILHRWKLKQPQTIVEKVNTETSLFISLAHVNAFFEFLSRHQLLKSTDFSAVNKLFDTYQRNQKSLSGQVLKHYLFFKIPLFRPDNFLSKTLPAIKFLFQPVFFYLLAALVLLGFFLVSRQWDEFLHTFQYFYSLEGLLVFALALFFSKAFHELGHAYMAKYYGLKVPTIGVAFLVMWPVLYTDTTEAWKLNDARKRFKIGIAGMTAEILLAALATLAWSLAGDGAFKSAMFMLATTTWVLTLAINLNPLMRFDGYYLFSDFLGVNNLQERSFALAKWNLRELLFDLKHPPPEQLRLKTQKTLIYFAWATWTYRFFLFLAIALLVYYFFFKLAGIFLMLVELFWFIFMPVYREVKTWKTFSKDMTFNRNTFTLALIVVSLIGLLFIPWQNVVYLPSVAMYEKKMTLYSPEDGKVRKLNIQNDQFVAKGQILFEVSSEDLDHEISRTQQQLEINRKLLDKVQISSDEIEDLFIAEQRYLETESALNGLLSQREKMVVKAGFDGKIVDMADDIYPGMFLNHKTPVADLVAVDSLVVESFFYEEQLSRLSADSEKGIFYPAVLHQPPVKVSLVSIDDSSADTLSQPMLASVHQGEIPVVQGEDGVLKPDQAVYRAVFKPDNTLTNALANKIKGTVHIDAENVSYIRRAWDHIVMIFLRESGF